MKFVIEQSDEYDEVQIYLKCGQIDSALEKLIEQIRLYGFSIVGEKDGKTIQLNLKDVFYLEAVDNKAYAYCEHEVYECRQKLYEMEERLSNLNFQRISRSCIVNISKLYSIRTMLNGKIEITMENEEKLIVNRHYAEPLREKIYSQGEM